MAAVSCNHSRVTEINVKSYSTFLLNLSLAASVSGFNFNSNPNCLVVCPSLNFLTNSELLVMKYFLVVGVYVTIEGLDDYY